jgi:membrane protein insertase Oxa1/YidC/SpoIIIJ
MTAQMTYIVPIFSAYIALRLPLGLPLYWIVTTLFAVGQQYYIKYQEKQGLVPTNS